MRDVTYLRGRPALSSVLKMWWNRGQLDRPLITWPWERFQYCFRSDLYSNTCTTHNCWLHTEHMWKWCVCLLQQFVYLGIVLVKQEAPWWVHRFDWQLIGTNEKRSFQQICRRHRGTTEQNTELWVYVCMCMCLTRGEKVLMDTQPPSRPPPQLLHLLSLFELLHLL